MRFYRSIILLCVALPAWAAEPASQQDKQEKTLPTQDLWSSEKALGCKPLSAADATKLGIIRQMLNAAKPHAALAYLDAAKIEAPQADLLRANALRQTGREDSAENLYQRLTRSCIGGYAYQGLGLISAKRGRLPEAVEQLRAASTALPVDAAIRNDYGYVLMLSGQHQGALHEFLTAIELTSGNRQAARNLVLLLYRTQQQEKARAFAEQFGIGAAELGQLQTMAVQHLPDQNAAVITSPLRLYELPQKELP